MIVTFDSGKNAFKPIIPYLWYPFNDGIKFYGRWAQVQNQNQRWFPANNVGCNASVWQLHRAYDNSSTISSLPSAKIHAYEAGTIHGEPFISKSFDKHDVHESYTGVYMRTFSSEWQEYRSYEVIGHYPINPIGRQVSLAPNFIIDDSSGEYSEVKCTTPSSTQKLRCLLIVYASLLIGAPKSAPDRNFKEFTAADALETGGITFITTSTSGTKVYLMQDVNDSTYGSWTHSSHDVASQFTVGNNKYRVESVSYAVSLTTDYTGVYSITFPHICFKQPYLSDEYSGKRVVDLDGFSYSFLEYGFEVRNWQYFS